MATYPDISDHGLIGDLQTAALVATDGTVDWFRSPRFDSPSVFASLLDAEGGGYCRVAFSHLALISAAINLDRQLDHSAGQVELGKA